jgi:type IV pilus assembly protein PilE
MHHDLQHARRRHGFTLIELMIVVTVVALLATVALPSYQGSMRKSRRGDAFAALMRLQQAQEHFRGSNPQYASALSALPGSAPSRSPEGLYDLAIHSADSHSYTLTATAASDTPQFGDTQCRKLTVVMTQGSLSNQSFDAAGTPTTRCWVVK